MNTGPGQPDREPLTPEEREWAQRLSRLGPSAGPPSAIDARILAAAHDAVAKRPPARDRGRRRWPLALGVAASLALAVGIAWRLRPMPELAPARDEAEVAAARTVGGPAPPAEPMYGPAPATVRIEPPPPPQEAKRESKEQDKPEIPEQARPTPIVLDDLRANDAAMAPPAPAAPPPPPAPAPIAAEAAAATAAANADMTAGAAASAQESERMQKAAEAVSAQRAKTIESPEVSRREAQAQKQAADADIDIAGSDDGDEPPAYANSPQVREAWLRRIRELIAEGNLQQAHDSLDEFQRRYPDQPLPEDLKQFEQSKHGSLLP
ncbi:hypothetical protein FCE95_01155 [Luteimonas gilva]|uniref:Uncharacterized protein n=1 Tax=Luteimonas gilva TaxID=2572684 RepID=A0A4U5JWC7_9GAMM|nr:hypothetical protein [Luteimonas gilva]TKR32961.1 hypothetical protein FCE95_01155 [Luteimonas gilva]